MDKPIYTLPKNWVIAKLGDVVLDIKSDFVDGPFGSNLKASEYKEDGIPVFRIQNIKAGYFLDKNIQFVSEQKYEQLIRHTFKTGDVIITKLGEPLGLCCKVPNKYPRGIIVADLMRIRPSHKIIDTDYLVYAINSQIIQNQFKLITKGTTRARVNLTIVRQIEIPIAPLSEQKFIVSKIEELISELENGKEQLELALNKLKIYRQSLLKNAFEGKLTKEWRKLNKQTQDIKTFFKSISEDRLKKAKASNQQIKKLKSLKKDELNELPKLPKGWTWCRNEELLDYTTSGSRDWKKYYNQNGALFIRTQDIKTNSLNLQNVAKVKLPKNIEGKRSLVEKNDILMTITGANVGKVARIETEIGEAYVSQSVALMKYVNKGISPWMFYYFQAKGFGKTLIESKVYGVGRPVLSLSNMREVPVCICPIDEQNKIIEELDTQLSICDKLEEIITKSIKQSEYLKQSIFIKAFEGKLIKQNINSKNAEILLQDFKKEREIYLEMKTINRQRSSQKIKSKKMEEKLKSIIQLLNESNKPISSYSLWKSSEHMEDIDSFYSKLKEHIDKGEVEELPRNGKDIFLTISSSK